MKLNIIKRGKGNPLVFFHGWGFDHSIWLPLVPELENYYQLYLVDLPGYGHSAAMSWDDFKSNLIKALPETFAVAGWSLGGLYASRLTIEEPNRVTHLVNIASSPFFIKDNSWPGVDKLVFAQFYADLVADPLRTISQFLGLQANKQSSKEQILQIPDPASLKEGLQILSEWDLRDALGLVTIPTCFMFGRLDTITSRTTMAAMKKRYPHFDYVLFTKAAHIPFLSEKDEFITRLTSFL